METIKIVDGDFATKEQTKVRFEETKELKTVIEVSEQECLDTISSLEARKAYVVAEIDAEIAINQDRLNKIRALGIKTKEIK